MKVRAPASTANLGPGFDQLAAALDLHLELVVSDREGWSYVHDGPGAPESPPDGSLVRSAIEAVTGETSDVGLEMRSAIPVGRGLGSSGAAIAAGLLVGRMLAERDIPPHELLAIGTALEGHPDNLAATLFGGIVNVVHTDAGPDVLSFKPSKNVKPVVLVPSEVLSTGKARQVLPKSIPLADAIANSSRAAGLLSMLTGTVDVTQARLWEFTKDTFHQPARASLMPKTTTVLEALRSAGIAAAVSGAGPSIVCLVVGGQETGIRSALAAKAVEDFEVLELDWAAEGARFV